MLASLAAAAATAVVAVRRLLDKFAVLTFSPCISVVRDGLALAVIRSNSAP